MILNKWKLRRIFETRGRTGFVHWVYNALGLADAQGRRYLDAFGRQEIREAELRPQEIATNHLAEAIFGQDLERVAHGGTLERFERFAVSGPDNTHLLEAGGGGVDVTQFLNINTYNATVGGLIDFQVLEGFNMPGYDISEQLFPSRATKLNGQRMGRIGSIGDAAARRLPGEPTKRVGLQEEYIDTPETQEFALSIEVNQEAWFFDLTGDILNKANSIGEAVKYRKELRCVDVFAGISNPYKYGGTASNTYQTATPWINDQVNPLVDEDDLNDCLQIFMQMTDPASGKRIIIRPDTLVTVPSIEMKVAQILQATATEQRTQISSSAATEVRHTVNWISGKIGNVITSPLLHMRLLDADGAALSETNSKRWWLLQKAGTFAYMENWPLRVDQANPGTLEMVDRGILAFYKASERGVPIVLEPRKSVRNKVA